MEGHLCAKDCTSKSITDTHARAHVRAPVHLKNTPLPAARTHFLLLCGSIYHYYINLKAFPRCLLCFSSIRPSIRPSPLLFSPSPLLPNSLHPLHLSTPVISPFNFTYLELAADSLKYLGVHFRYALIHRWADTAFVCTRRGDEAAASVKKQL